MVIRNMSELYRQPRLVSKPCRGRDLCFSSEADRLTETLNKNSRRNIVGVTRTTQLQITNFEPSPIPFLEFHLLPVLV